MTGAAIAGIVLTLLAGSLSGNCMLPVKFVKHWRWENIWLVFSVVSLVLLPWLLALILVDGLFNIYRNMPLQAFIVPLAFGAGWGIAQIIFGISVRRLGMGLGYAIIVGLGAVLGTIVPLLLAQRTLPRRSALVEITIGVTVMVIGIACTAWGGKVRERYLSESNFGAKESHSSPQEVWPRSFVAAILLAVLCGFMAPMLNYAFAFGQPLAVEAVRIGNSPIHAAYAVWPIALLGGFLPNLAYSLILLRRNHSWSGFQDSPADLGLSLAMASFWMGAFAIYGMSSVLLGPLGVSVGWALFQIFMIMTATLSGVLTGEWRRAPRQAILPLAIGMASLILATCLLAAAST